jgi:uncharacterized membrane protein YgcG
MSVDRLRRHFPLRPVLLAVQLLQEVCAEVEGLHTLPHLEQRHVFGQLKRAEILPLVRVAGDEKESEGRVGDKGSSGDGYGDGGSGGGGGEKEGVKK